MNLAALLAVSACLSACQTPQWPSLFAPDTAQTDAAPADSPEASGPTDSPEMAVVAIQPLDPLNAPPPPTSGSAMADPLLVPAPSAAPPDSSQRVPLGTLAAAPPAAAPMPLIQPPAAPAPPVQAPVVQAAPAQMAAVPAPAAPLPAPVLTPPVAPTTVVAPQPARAQDDETVVISSATTAPILDNREFLPASVIPEPSLPVRGLGEIPMTAAERNVIQRFETLRRLYDETLITQEEYLRRRAANIGALLPYTRDPGGVGLERSVPNSDAIIARLMALRRSFEMRAISASQHALERTMILNALLPENPEEREDRKPPPSDVIEGAAMAGRLENLRLKNLISAAELEGEKNAIEHVLRTGLLPSQELASTAKPAAAKPVAAKPRPAAATEADALGAEITGPVLHLASFRSEDSARQAWQNAVAQNKTAFASLKPIIHRVDLGPERGIFYRLMAGTFSSVADAEAVCIQLKQNNQFCRASADGT